MHKHSRPSLRQAMMAGAGIVAIGLTALLIPANVARAILAGDAARGQMIYQRCMSCHSPDMNRIGPAHRGVFGRAAGSVAGYAYSDALKQSGIIWDEERLDRWLSGPRQLVPGAKMTFSLSDPQARMDVIAFLKTLR